MSEYDACTQHAIEFRLGVVSAANEVCDNYIAYHEMLDAVEPDHLTILTAATASRDAAHALVRRLAASIEMYGDVSCEDLPDEMHAGLSDLEDAWGTYITEYAVYVADNVRAGDVVADESRWREAEDAFENAAGEFIELVGRWVRDTWPTEVLPACMQPEAEPEPLPFVWDSPKTKGLVN